MPNVGDYKISFSIDLTPYKEGLEGMLNMTQSAAQQIELILNLKVKAPDMSGIEAAFQRSIQETEQYVRSQQEASQATNKEAASAEKAGQEVSDLSEKTRAATESNKGFASSAGEVFFRLGALQMGINAVKDSVGEWMKLENQHVAAEAQLAQAMKNRGIYTAEAVKRAEEFADAQQRLTGIDNDSILQAMSMLTIAGAQGEELKKMTVITENFGRIMAANTGGQVDMASAARAVAEVMAGNVGILSRYGIMLSDTAKKSHDMTLITDELTAKTKDQAEAFGKELPGQEAIAGAALDDLKKKWGSILNGEIADTIPALTDVFEGLQNLPPSLQVVTMGVTALGGAFLLLGGVASPWLFAIGGAVTALLAAKRAIEEFLPSIGDQISSIKADDKAVKGLTGSLEKMTTAQKEATVARLKDELVDLNKKFSEGGIEVDKWGSFFKSALAQILGVPVEQIQMRLTAVGKQTMEQIANVKAAINEVNDSMKPKGAPPPDTADAAAKAKEEADKLQKAGLQRREEMAKQVSQMDEAEWQTHLAALELNLRTEGKTEQQISDALNEERKNRIKQQIQELNSIQGTLTADQALKRVQLEKELTDILNAEYKQRSADELEAKKSADKEIEDWQKQQDQAAEERARARLQQARQDAMEMARAGMGGVEALFGEANRSMEESFGKQKTLVEKFLAGTLRSVASYLERKLEMEITNSLASVLITRTTEQSKTDATQQGALARIASGTMETVKDLAVAAGKMVTAAASAIASAFEAIPFPLDIVAAGGAVAAVYGLWEGAKKMFGFAEGGRVTEPTLGVFGENGPEILAPEKDFLSVFSDVLLPQIRSEYLLSQGSVSATGGTSSVNLLHEIRGLRKDLVESRPYMGKTISKKELAQTYDHYYTEQRDRLKT